MRLNSMHLDIFLFHYKLSLLQRIQCFVLFFKGVRKSSSLALAYGYQVLSIGPLPKSLRVPTRRIVTAIKAAE